MIDDAIGRLEKKNSLEMPQMESIVDLIMQGKCSDHQMERLLTGLYEKGESEEELAGAALAMRRHMAIIETNRNGVVDTCGTGGGGTGTFNISTAAALIASAAGAVVAKHGNRKATSKSGSADVLTELGVNISPSIEVVQRCLDELGICFCFAPLFHQSVRHVVAVRQRLPFPTIFNLLGPLCNPARAPYQVLGAGRGPTQELLARALARVGTTRSVVVHGLDGLGEVTNQGATRVFEVIGTSVSEKFWSPADFGMEETDRERLLVDSPTESARAIREVCEGKPGPRRDVAVMNAAAALFITERAESLAQASQLCLAAIDDGRVSEKIERLAQLSNE